MNSCLVATDHRRPRPLPSLHHAGDTTPHLIGEEPDKRTGLEAVHEHVSTNTALVCYPEELIRSPILDERPTKAVVEAC